MKNPAKFSIELLITLVVAYLLSLIVSILLAFIVGNTGSVEENAGAINWTGGVIFGLLVGYKLNDLLRKHK